MAKNRVEDLETTVAELESTINGLTEELVETKERLRQLEQHVDGDVPSGATPRRTEPADEGVDAEGATGDTGVEVETADPAESEAQPEDVAEAASEADKETEPESEDQDDGDSGLGDDIIVA